MRFDFNFDKIYKLLLEKVRKGSRLKLSKYHYLENDDLFHDILELSFDYLKDKDKVDENTFVSIFWSNWKILKLRSFDKRNPRVREAKNKVAIEDYLHPQVLMLDLDTKFLIRRVKESYPTVQKVISGYSFAEAGREEGISTSGYRQRYEKELSNLKRSYE